MSTSLYLVPTPIGNLEDMTHRAVRILREVDLVLAEDTRTSGVLLKHYGIEAKLQSYHIHNEHKTLQGLIDKMKGGTTMALVSDSGTPAISDPGFLLVRECLRNELVIECLPGPTAMVPALVKSGFPTDRFVFEGFLPHKKGRATRIKEIAEEKRTVVLYESPHRVQKLLQQLLEVCGPERWVSVSRELTKVYEETITSPLGELNEQFANKNIKGEFVVVISGSDYEQ